MMPSMGTLGKGLAIGGVAIGGLMLMRGMMNRKKQNPQIVTGINPMNANAMYRAGQQAGTGAFRPTALQGPRPGVIG